MNIIKHRKIYFTISGLLVAISIFVIALFGLNLGIDFTGGSLMEISVDKRVSTDAQEIGKILTEIEVIQDADSDENSEGQDNTSKSKPLLENVRVQKTGELGYLLRFRDVSQQEHEQIMSKLNFELSKQLPKDETKDADSSADASEDITEAVESSIQATDSEGNPIDIQLEPVEGVVAQSSVITIGGEIVVNELRFESIGPVIGEELKQKAIYAIITVIIAIVFYIAWAFRKVSDPVSSWKYGVTAIIALMHDVIIPTGVFAILGYAAGIEMDILFVTALLTIIGFSVNDTIVVFDRTRENLSRDHHRHEFEWIVNKSVNETIRRSIYTSLTTFVVLLSIYLFGGASISNFVLALMIGVVVGTYSSIFLASPLLVAWFKRSQR